MDGNATKSKRDERRDTILKIAGEVFYEQGFAGASMSEIAARLGGSKGTLYNYFVSKDELFEAFVRERCGAFWEQVFSFAAGEELPVREVLTLVGEAAFGTLDESLVRLIRILIAESQRSPHMSRIFFDTGPDAKAHRLAGYLERAKARGEIDAPDCLMAARQFLALFRGGYYFERLLNLVGPEDTPRARKEIAAAVDMFMAAYARPRPSAAASSGSAAHPKARAQPALG